MYEIIVNAHIHSSYSDGSKHHAEIAKDASKAGIDALIFTDHNIFIKGIEGYFGPQENRVLIIMGEEIHDQNTFPQKNHILSFGTSSSMSGLSGNRQQLINKVQADDGLSFIAHPYDPALPAFNEPDISWEDWSITGFTGIEIWNGFSEVKIRVKKKLQAYFYAFFPRFVPISPPERITKIWDALLNKGQKIVAIGGSDAHAMHLSAGPFRRVVFPYQYHFSSINNHILIEKRLSGDPAKDKRLILNAIRSGHLFISNDLIQSPKGFRFWIRYKDKKVSMGDSIRYSEKLKIQAFIPKPAECRIYKDGKVITTIRNAKEIELPVKSKGVYRIECYKRYLGRMRGWIYSNPIYIQ